MNDPLMNHKVIKLSYKAISRAMAQCADGESNKIVWDKKETVTA